VITASAIYAGQVRHRRFAPVTNAFRYPLYMMYLDLAELDEVLGLHPLYGRGANIATFRRRDHLGSLDLPLDTTVRDLVGRRTGRRPIGPIRLLTHLRYFGHCFNPVSFYYCYDGADRDLECIVAEVHNTPWHEEYCYVCDVRTGARRGGWFGFEMDKRFHVSPFMPMAQRYLWRFRRPAGVLGVYMQSFQAGRRVFDAKLTLRREPMTRSNLSRVLWRYPAMTVKVVAAIHAQALRLSRKGAPFYVHPRKLESEAGV
jgi:uncharacterized protein